MDDVQIHIQLVAVVVTFSLMVMLMMTLGVVGKSVELNLKNRGQYHLVPFVFPSYAIGRYLPS